MIYQRLFNYEIGGDSARLSGECNDQIENQYWYLGVKKALLFLVSAFMTVEHDD
ncbi:hypothetical protein I593_01223 [Acinetobacter tandoii DSM 14970 = CIP 107469]|uniref:Uncharacterized protein n=1 Tax=Acinetobacter tandoii DSM 14970 = CIP 107469 TaxID=1120927 RepID=R9B3Z5_9GAMM|nr:hypothetical protein I593_01223 [Acinetobacter tandoii DSM 14970 = CIP 107469]